MKPDNFIGKSGVNARILLHQIPKLKKMGTPTEERRYLFTGPPGTAKTTIAELMAKSLTVHSSFIEQINGQSCTIEQVRKWRDSAAYIPFDTIVQIVDEIDSASIAAQNELRTYLDKLGSRTVFIATTNKPLKELQEQLQSRFKVFYFSAIPSDEIASYIMREFGLSLDAATRVAAGSNGNVRAARLTAMSIVEAQEALA